MTQSTLYFLFCCSWALCIVRCTSKWLRVIPFRLLRSLCLRLYLDIYGICVVERIPNVEYCSSKKICNKNYYTRFARSFTLECYIEKVAHLSTYWKYQTWVRTFTEILNTVIICESYFTKGEVFSLMWIQRFELLRYIFLVNERKLPCLLAIIKAY